MVDEQYAESRLADALERYNRALVPLRQDFPNIFLGGDFEKFVGAKGDVDYTPGAEFGNELTYGGRFSGAGSACQ
ncbi:hypothetical protein WI97_08925 [Burkholderia vietnamiensis]|nr:hypothetical protein WI97_08925 [Burkholderia vietnamiensis]